MVTSKATRASVVIPAHDEETVIGRCLDSLASQGAIGGVDVVVVANGCSDATAEAARAYRGRIPHLTVIERREPGKIGALNQGDAVASSSARIYLDADVELTPGTLDALVDAVDVPEPVCVAPPPVFDTEHASGVVKAFYAMFNRLPYVTEGLVGLGVYGLSASGRNRFEQFPALTADDLWVQRLFAATERRATGGHFVVRTPRSLGALIAVRTRVAYGNSEVAQLSETTADTSATTGSTLAGLVAQAGRDPRLWWPFLVYVAVTITARLRARRSSGGWQRDDSSRRTASPSPDPTVDRVHIDGVPFDALSETGVVDRVLEGLTHGSGGLIITANVDILRQLRRPAHSSLVSAAALVVADGMPIVWASALQGDRLPARVTGADLVWSLSEAAARSGHSIYLLGGAPGVADRAATALASSFPGLRVAGTSAPERGFDASPETLRPVVADVVDASPDLVFVALGFPRQERVALAIAERMPTAWYLGCGGALDMAAGDLTRASSRWQQVGGEWIIRLVQQPRRLAKRYLVDDIPYAVALLARSASRRSRAER